MWSNKGSQLVINYQLLLLFLMIDAKNLLNVSLVLLSKIQLNLQFHDILKAKTKKES